MQRHTYTFIAVLFVPVKTDWAKCLLLQDQINKLVYIRILQKYSINLKIYWFSKLLKLKKSKGSWSRWWPSLLIKQKYINTHVCICRSRLTFIVTPLVHSLKLLYCVCMTFFNKKPNLWKISIFRSFKKPTHLISHFFSCSYLRVFSQLSLLCQ